MFGRFKKKNNKDEIDNTTITEISEPEVPPKIPTPIFKEEFIKFYFCNSSDISREFNVINDSLKIENNKVSFEYKYSTRYDDPKIIKEEYLLDNIFSINAYDGKSIYISESIGSKISFIDYPNKSFFKIEIKRRNNFGYYSSQQYLIFYNNKLINLSTREIVEEDKLSIYSNVLENNCIPILIDNKIDYIAKNLNKTINTTYSQNYIDRCIYEAILKEKLRFSTIASMELSIKDLEELAK